MNILSHQCQIEQREQAFFNKTHSSFDKASKANCYDQGLFMTHPYMSFSDTILKKNVHCISLWNCIWHMCVSFSNSEIFHLFGVLEDKDTISVLFWSHANDSQSIMVWLCCSGSVSTIHNGRLWQSDRTSSATLLKMGMGFSQWCHRLLKKGSKRGFSQQCHRRNILGSPKNLLVNII